MISVMDMTTGEWESERLAVDGFIPSMDASQPAPPLQAGLREYMAEQVIHAGMPVGVAALDLDDFLARMTESAC